MARVLSLLCCLTAICAAQSTNDQLWDATVAPYLTADLWSQTEAYDAGHYLFIPQSAAMRKGANLKWRTQIRAMYKRWEAAGYPVADPTGNTHLNQLQFLYLAASWGRIDAYAPNTLHAFLKNRVMSLWYTDPAFQWAHKDFVGMQARLQWKLQAGLQPRSYYTVIIDEEMFLLATAAELRTWERLHNLPPDPVLQEIGDMTRTVCTRMLVPSGDGLLIQPGLWTDHSDYAYAGNPFIVANMLPSPVPGISQDTSHSIRLAPFLASFWAADSAARPFYRSLLDKLDAQFLNHVVLQPDSTNPFLRTTNFMDGRDGVYRWQYSTAAGSGYDASQLSGTATLGWWSLTGTPRMTAYYSALASQFPLSDQAVTTYIGPNTTRVRNPLVADPASFTNGFRLLLCRLAARLQN